MLFEIALTYPTQWHIRHNVWAATAEAAAQEPGENSISTVYKYSQPTIIMFMFIKMILQSEKQEPPSLLWLPSVPPCCCSH